MSRLNSPIRALGYLGVRGTSIDAWSDYACGFLGMQAAERGSGFARFRMDERAHRLTVHEDAHCAGPNAVAYYGWELADSAALQALAARLESRGVAVKAGDAALCAERGVADLIVFNDPAGNRLEAFQGAADAGKPFAAGRSVTGFRTGKLGMGHVVLTVADAGALLHFYRDVLGFGLSDYITAPFTAYFMHVNGRHHTLALIQTGKPAVHHFMIEMLGLDDVGQGYDIALGIPDRIGTTLGRHTNDFMTSFYARTPSEFMVEVGWGGRVIEPANWDAFEVKAGPSLWGHDRNWIGPDAQKQARELRLRVAAEGLRHPVQVVPGQYEVMPQG